MKRIVEYQMGNRRFGLTVTSLTRFDLISRTAARLTLFATAFYWVLLNHGSSQAQGPVIRYGTKVPQDVKIIYERGLKYLAETQKENGAWPGNYASGVTSLSLLAFLAKGEDPNFGRHRLQVQRAVRYIIRNQDPSSG